MTGIRDVVCIHGLWMPGLEMSLLRRRLEHDHGYRPHAFSYQSLAGDLGENIDRLRAFVEELDVDRLHIVAHSLGGIVTLQMLRRHPDMPVERVVCLGSPLVDSGPARKILRYDWGESVIGRTLTEGVLEDPLGEWVGQQEVGVIAGTVSFGLGIAIMSLETPNDGVVSLRETRLPGLADHVELAVSHSGMLVSSAVAGQAAAFLADGQFARE